MTGRVGKLAKKREGRDFPSSLPLPTVASRPLSTGQRECRSELISEPISELVSEFISELISELIGELISETILRRKMLYFYEGKKSHPFSGRKFSPI